LSNQKSENIISSILKTDIDTDKLSFAEIEEKRNLKQMHRLKSRSTKNNKNKKMLHRNTAHKKLMARHRALIQNRNKKSK